MLDLTTAEILRFAQRVAYGDLGGDSPPTITLAYKRRPEPVITLQLERAAVSLGYLLDEALR